MPRPILILTLILFSISFSFAQDRANESQVVALPDPVMSNVINRIVRWKFKPSRTKRKIPVADRLIKREWLPVIANVEFDLVPEDEVMNYEKGVLIFEDVTQLSGSVYSINVGWGDVDCDAFGEIWKFSVKDQQVRLWPTRDSWGRGCGGNGNGPRPVRGLTIGEVSPNELPGYEFFAKGKLKNIRLGISTREDMIRIFGDACEAPHDYDENWEIWVNYFNDDPKSYGTVTVGEEEFGFRPKPEIVGTLRFVRLTPKNRISFSKLKFSPKFGKLVGMAIGDGWDENGFAGAVHTSIDSYIDGFGLKYEIYDEETFNNVRNKARTEKKPQKGDLLAVEYEIPDSLEDKVYDKFPVRPK